MSVKRISRLRVVAPLAEYVDEGQLGTQESRKTVTDQKHGGDVTMKAGGDVIWKTSPDTARATTPANKATTPNNKFSV